MINKIDVTLSGFQGITTIEDKIGFQSKLIESLPRNCSGYIDFNILRFLKANQMTRSNVICHLIKRTIKYPYFGYQPYD